MINYAEPGSGDELDGALDSDDSDFIASGGTKAAVRSSFRSRSGVTTFISSQGGTPVPATPAQGQTAGKSEIDQSYVGQEPPSKFITPKPAHATKHEYLYVTVPCHVSVLAKSDS